MGSCISSYSPRSTLKPPPPFPCMSKAWSFSRKEMKKRRKNGNDVNNGSCYRRTAINGCGGGEGGCGLVEEELQHVPGRLFQNGGSDVACLYTQQGKKGTNQDAMLVWENFASKSDTIFCGVFDGHGPCGHMVSKKVRDSLPLKLFANWTHGNDSTDNSPRKNAFFPGSMDFEETTPCSIADDCCSQDVNENEKLPEMYLTLRQSFLKAFMLTDKELKFHPTIDCFCSGSTAVTVIKQGQDLVIGNVGDSRAILGTRDNDNDLVAVQLTVDLKPNLPREAERIQQCNGRVFALQDEPEVARVWLPNNDSPGLAMARAFGDFCLKDYGLISVPDISYRRLTEKDEFIVLATDGIWDALSNREVIDIVSSAPTRGSAARALVDSAVRSWRLKFPTSKIDDCAAICLFLDPQPSPHESPKDSTEEISLASVSQEEAKNAEANIQMKEEVDESAINVAQTLESSYSTTLDTDEIVPMKEPKHDFKSARSLADCISTTDEEEWTALEGITRVNSLLNMPRFLSGEKKTSWRKWL